MKATNDNDEIVRVAAVTALGRIGDPASGSPLIVALGDVNPPVRSAAAAALGKFGGRTAIAPLAAALGDPERSVRLSAVVALASIRDTAAVPPLIACLKDRDSEVVIAAAKALGEIRDPRAVSPLKSALLTCPESARWTVGLSLKLLTEIPLLIGALDNGDSLVRRNAEYLLWLITGKKLGYDKAVWANWFVSRNDTARITLPYTTKDADTAGVLKPK
jgi:HEAT repeat protein